MEAYNVIPEWNEIIFKELTPEGEVYLSGTGGNVDEVTAWMPLPNPYKEE